MKFDEITSRLSGISCPVFGVSWNPPESERKIARRVIAFLENRRVLFSPFEWEMPDHCAQSVIEMRHFLTTELQALDADKELAQCLRVGASFGAGEWARRRAGGGTAGQRPAVLV